jgi:hypothetical protein
MVSASSYLQPPLPPHPSHLWATLTKREELIVKLTLEDDDYDVDELGGDEGEPWHPSASPRTHARHTPSLPHHLRTLEGMEMGPPPKILFGFELDDAPCLRLGVAGWSAHKLNSCNNSGRRLFSSLIFR